MVEGSIDRSSFSARLVVGAARCVTTARLCHFNRTEKKTAVYCSLPTSSSREWLVFMQNPSDTCLDVHDGPLRNIMLTILNLNSRPLLRGRVREGETIGCSQSVSR